MVNIEYDTSYIYAILYPPLYEILDFHINAISQNVDNLLVRKS